MKFRLRLLFQVCFFYLLSLAVFAESSLQVIALFDNKAMISVNGSKAKIINIGQIHKGVKLISSNTQEAVVEYSGSRQTLTLNSAVLLSENLGTKVEPKQSIQIWADNSGFFKGSGEINGQELTFLVDTGASLVVMSSRQAERIGLDYKSGRRTNAVTASGFAPMYQITAQKVSVEGLELNNVETGVIEGSFPPITLLGMSFLSRLDMSRSGNRMDLNKR